jgi:hypothetical protein
MTNSTMIETVSLPICGYIVLVMSISLVALAITVLIRMKRRSISMFSNPELSTSDEVNQLKPAAPRVRITQVCIRCKSGVSQV